jgi:hypothetical protein
MYPWYSVGGKMSDNNLKQRINITLCVRIGKSASEILDLLTLAYGEHTMNRWSVLEWHRWFEEGRKNVQDDPRSGQPKYAKYRCKCGLSINLGAIRSKIRCEINSRTEYEKENSVTDYYG